MHSTLFLHLSLFLAAICELSSTVSDQTFRNSSHSLAGGSGDYQDYSVGREDGKEQLRKDRRTLGERIRAMNGREGGRKEMKERRLANEAGTGSMKEEERDRRNPMDATDLHEPEVDGSDTRALHRFPVRSHDDEVSNRKDNEDDLASDRFILYRGDRAAYCAKYRDNYAFFCAGGESSSEDRDVIKSFCPSYKGACGVSRDTPTSSSSSSFSPVFTQSSSHIEAPSERRESTEEERRSKLLEEVKKRYPCKPDCDRRLHPHCTTDCKCDYIYPAVQNFCNPPPLPLFLNTCRLWYHGCPKYERYHYASQYIYSKAEKGKVLPGPVSNPNPLGLPPPAVPLS